MVSDHHNYVCTRGMESNRWDLMTTECRVERMGGELQVVAGRNKMSRQEDGWRYGLKLIATKCLDGRRWMEGSSMVDARGILGVCEYAMWCETKRVFFCCTLG